MTERIRIKDIAKRSGVSVGTVDRVLHNRPNVSETALKKLEMALAEMNYQPNMYASALAYNKSYTFFLFIPKHEEETYWQEIEEGAAKAMESRRDFHIDVKFIYYERFNDDSFRTKSKECLQQKPDGVVVVPAEFEITREFTETLHENNIPFILLDSYMPELKPLSFYGQDSLSSGFFAAKILMMKAFDNQEIMLMKQMKNGHVSSTQQVNREVGFRNYMKTFFPNVKIIEVNLPRESSKEEYANILEDYFTTHPNTHHCITLNSKAHIVGEFLLKTHRNNIQIMGYDMVAKNAECIKKGSISFLIAQHAYQQGYSCVDALFRTIVLKKKVQPVNYMPIELIMKENIDFYRRTQL